MNLWSRFSISCHFSMTEETCPSFLFHRAASAFRQLISLEIFIATFIHQRRMGQWMWRLKKSQVSHRNIVSKGNGREGYAKMMSRAWHENFVENLRALVETLFTWRCFSAWIFILRESRESLCTKRHSAKNWADIWRTHSKTYFTADSGYVSLRHLDP